MPLLWSGNRRRLSMPIATERAAADELDGPPRKKARNTCPSDGLRATDVSNYGVGSEPGRHEQGRHESSRLFGEPALGQ
jgi:hypothetical protein